MQRKARKAYVPGLAALLALVAAGCSAGGDGVGSAMDTKPGSPSTPAAAQPGKYRTLREPCGSVPRATLKDLLPGVSSLPEAQQEEVYAGRPSVTYDTDRRVGCGWKADSPDASHQLEVDLERVVSYDPAVSDDDRAREVYATKQSAASLPSPGVPGSSTPPASGPTGTTGASGTGGTGGAATQTGSSAGSSADPSTGSGDASQESAQGPSGTPAADGLEPRLLDGLGEAAFLNDVLARSGSAAQHRTVSVVFRTSNVIVTVRYTEQPAHSDEVPDSKELQEKARGLARKLAEQLNA
ncbi:DUF3558 domain-containing protein [Streptomyces sp. NPDC051569]|uniref:DUF3558 domain-containing protein n=1 Tax=Streptomyces sp. NPDC051569 TaxID=3365661 RepID=UPI003798F621